MHVWLWTAKLMFFFYNVHKIAIVWISVFTSLLVH